MSAPQRDHSRDVSGIHRLGYATKNDFVHQSWVQPGTGQQGIDSDTAEFVRAE